MQGAEYGIINLPVRFPWIVRSERAVEVDDKGDVRLSKPLHAMISEIIACYMVDAEDRISLKSKQPFPFDPQVRVSARAALSALLLVLDDLTDWLERPIPAEVVNRAAASLDDTYVPTDPAPAGRHDAGHDHGGEG